ncbi:hypothetical protein BDZ85DRAFT_258581 [Elsinoe ampelina]|uniref:Tautomerase cis-CaaD-like domain-containing protein n=1 Tax=Elsinoe ampelina TaxID=302913 RepID=A0A6A6GK66_9PEZI|nr:hypothetical protein BDZ85DRAFT_258581 [Elsinoe ampelina]
MPLYQIYHSYPLSQEQKQVLATSITTLHATTFTTPSFFVHVRFIPEDSAGVNYFMAGKPHQNNANRVVGIVRVSEKRSKSDFDALGEKIEKAWYDAVKGSSGDEEETALEQDEDGKRLIMVTFTPMITIRENGMLIPEAGGEAAWLKEHIGHIKLMSEGEGIRDFGDMLEEFNTREDLKGWLQ